MDNRFYNFLSKNELLLSLKFGLWQKYSFAHDLLNLTD